MAKTNKHFLDEVNKQNSEANNEKAFVQKRLDQKKLAEQLDSMRRQEKLVEREAKYAALAENAKPSWDEVQKVAHDFYHNPQHGYDNWRSAMSQLMDFTSKLATFAFKRIPSIRRGMTDFVGDSYDLLARKPELPDKELPGIEFNIGFNDHNELIINNLVSSDGVDLTYDESLAFQASVFYLLEEEGYQHDPNEPRKFFTKNDGSTPSRHLTPADEASIGPHGLGQFIEDKLKDMISEDYKLNSVKNVPRPRGF